MIHYDPRWAGPHGIGRFSAEVIPRLDAATAVDPGVRKLSLLDPVATTLAVGRLRSGVYFSPGFNPPLRSPIPFVFCLHDLIHLRFPGESTLLRRAYYRCVVLPASRRAFRVITVSEHSRGTILEQFRLPPERVAVVGCGVAETFRCEGPRHDPGYPYFLFVGRREAHKNIERLIAGYAASRCRGAVHLLFTGPRDRATHAQAGRYGVLPQVAFSHLLSDAELAAYYRGAVALVCPSLYEGFGLPIAEAMACGTPVLASSVSAIPETAGAGNTLIVDPLDSDSIADALDRLADDAPLRASLKQRGLARAREFSWQQVASKVGGILQAAQAGG